jgi:hypothetical protein
MANQKVCIKSGNKDLLRIIPFPSGSEYDFKISIVNNDFKLRIHPESVEPFYITENNFSLKKWELSYHNSNDMKPAKIHLKSISKHITYLNLPINNFTNPNKSSEFPIPLLKIGFSKSDSYNTYKPKSYYKIIDLNDNNVLEVFIVPSSFDWEKFITKWGLFDLIYSIAPMEYFVNGKLRAFSKAKLKALYVDNQYCRKLIFVNNEIALLCNFYNDTTIDGHRQKSFISVYENGNFLKYLLLAPINYYYQNNQLSPTKLAYEIQLDHIKHQITSVEYKYWQNFFYNINRKYGDCSLDIFSLQG